IHADEQAILYCNAIKTASESKLETFWSFFENQYFKEPYSEQRNKYLKALSCVTSKGHIERLLTWTTNDTLDFHDVDRVLLLKYVIANPVGRDIVLKFLDENFSALYKR
ncbi:Aminopeptidase N, partial [Orchesella cincta]